MEKDFWEQYGLNQDSRLVLSASVLSAHKMIKQIYEDKYREHPHLRRRLQSVLGHWLPVTIDEILAANIGKGFLPLSCETKTNPRNGYSYCTYSTGKLLIHVKKTRRYGALPEKSSFRCACSQLNEQLLLFEDERIRIVETVPKNYAIVVFANHEFELSYLRIGMPDLSYTRWDKISDLPAKDKISSIEEVIRDESTVKIKEDILEKLESSLGHPSIKEA